MGTNLQLVRKNKFCCSITLESEKKPIILYYIIKIPRREYFECSHHKEMINV
jgi:hypothetical protein